VSSAPAPSSRGRSSWRFFWRRLLRCLMLETGAAPESPPCVYTAAIHTKADLVSSLTGITRLARDLGFQRDPETHYASDGRSASYHVDHLRLPVALSIDCNPVRQTVAIAVSGCDGDLTYRCFRQVEASLFGAC
jgi:hypothetical protein